jgi:hypothetical protein
MDIDYLLKWLACDAYVAITSVFMLIFTGAILSWIRSRRGHKITTQFVTMCGAAGGVLLGMFFQLQHETRPRTATVQLSINLKSHELVPFSSDPYPLSPAMVDRDAVYWLHERNPSALADHDRLIDDLISWSVFQLMWQKDAHWRLQREEYNFSGIPSLRTLSRWVNSDTDSLITPMILHANLLNGNAFNRVPFDTPFGPTVFLPANAGIGVLDKTDGVKNSNRFTKTIAISSPVATIEIRRHLVACTD